MTTPDREDLQTPDEFYDKLDRENYSKEEAVPAWQVYLIMLCFGVTLIIGFIEEVKFVYNLLKPLSAP